MDTRIESSVEFLRNRGIVPEIFIVLGSGIDLSAITRNFSDVVELPFSEIPGFPKPTVIGHSGKLMFGRYNDKLPVALLFGRKHIYEGFIDDTLFIPAVMAELGANIAFFTSSTGGIDPKISPGDLILLKDILNLQGIWTAKYLKMLANRDKRKSPFDKKLTSLLSSCAIEAGIDMIQGVLASVTGPNYETPAEVQMLRKIGATVVSMSMAPEVTVSNSLKIRTVGIALVTNSAGAHSEHNEVLEAAKNASAKLVRVVESFLTKLL